MVIIAIRRFAFMLAGLSLLTGCFGGNGTTAATSAPTSTANVTTVTVDSGPSSANGQINHAYVTVKVCEPGTQTCASIDHVLLDTGSTGLRLVGSVLTAQKVALPKETDSQGQTIEECMSFTGGQTWGPVVLADVYLAGEQASKAPLQLMDDANSAAPAPATCGANGTLMNAATGFGANGVLGVGVFLQDCGQGCVSNSAPLPVYYGCSSAGACTAENTALALQVSNVVAQFASDNNGVIVNLPNLANANGDATVQGELIFGLGTQSDNMLPATLTVLGVDGSGNFHANYNGSTTALPALIDSGTDSFAFNDSTIAVCSSGSFIGYYCPTVAPLAVSTVNTGLGQYTGSATVNFAIGDPNTFVAGATAFSGLGGGAGSTYFIWGMPFFFGRQIYVGIEQRSGGSYTGPFYAY
ncbi:MAG TPA: DUF3443 family protein [Steroidobacteraceae bacterium]